MPSQPKTSIQAEVLGNIRRQPIGAHTVADLHLPEPFLRRVADRIILESFQEQHRMILAEGAGLSPPPVEPVPPETVARVVDRHLPPDLVRQRRSLPDDRPERRGFRTGDPALSLDARLADAAAIVARRLAQDGLLLTLAQVLERLDAVDAALIDSLDRIGLPTDLLAAFGAARDALQTVRAVKAELSRAGSATAAQRALTRFPFHPLASGFRADADSGQTPLDAFRVQITSGSYWSGESDGGCVDLVRQLIAALPEAALIASIERKHLDSFAGQVARWPPRPPLTLIPEDLPVAQWAQDNGKSARGADGGAVLITPRYASRGEVGAVFVPGETFLAEGLAAAGLRVIRSPLHFQGGNLIMVEEASGQRTLLVGEAEVCRNTALGLTREQAIEALRIQFGADRCIDLASPSFHIDFELSVRAMPDRTLAFVNDVAAAARLILQCGARALARAGSLAPVAADDACAHLAAQRTREALTILGPALHAAAVGPGRFSESFARRLTTGPQDHGPSNLHRVLHAMDVLTALSLAPAQWPADAHTRAYLETYTRQEADRKVLRRTIGSLGWHLVPVPSLADPYRGINALNGLHGPRLYLMPTYGGLFATVDEAAEAAFGRALGAEIEIRRIGCAETQRRSGALRCAVSQLCLPATFGSR